MRRAPTRAQTDKFRGFPAGGFGSAPVVSSQQELIVSKILDLGKACGNPRPDGKRPARTRCAPRSRLQLENLESREVPAVVAGAGEPSSDVMQASQMSAFFQQSALFSQGQPTSDPTQSWSAARPQDPREDVTTSPLLSLRILDEIDAIMDDEWRVEKSLLDSIPDRGGAAGESSLRSPSLRWERVWPSQVFAPYVDMTEWPTLDLVHARQTRGIQYFNLAFVSADSFDRPAWGGNDQCALGTDFDLALRRQVRGLRALGGDVAVSFGGPRRLELAQVITDVDTLKRTYRDVVDAYGVTRIDFDLENSVLEDTPAVERRSQALAALKRELNDEGRPLTIWFTLPAGPDGLSRDGVYVIEAAMEHGVALGGVNIRPSGRDDGLAPHATSRMGAVAIESAINVFYQLDKSLHRQEIAGDLWRRIGVTPTIGQGDAAGERFLPADAQAVFDFARQQGLGMLGIWSLNRDQYDSKSAQESAGLTSGVDQRAFEFSETFGPFTADAGAEQR
jgi:hypothetical protein